MMLRAQRRKRCHGTVVVCMHVCIMYEDVYVFKYVYMYVQFTITASTFIHGSANAPPPPPRPPPPPFAHPLSIGITGQRPRGWSDPFTRVAETAEGREDDQSRRWQVAVTACIFRQSSGGGEKVNIGGLGGSTVCIFQGKF